MSEQARKPYEVRMATLEDGREVIDELIVRHPVMVHFEHLGENGLWCGITFPGGREIHVKVWSWKGAKVWSWKGDVGWSVREDWPGGKEYADVE